jgi:hypothetical protein
MSVLAELSHEQIKTDVIKTLGKIQKIAPHRGFFYYEFALVHDKIN